MLYLSNILLPFLGRRCYIRVTFYCLFRIDMLYLSIPLGSTLFRTDMLYLSNILLPFFRINMLYPSNILLPF